MNPLRGSRQLERLREYTHLRPFLREFTWQRLHWFNESDANINKDIASTVTKLRFRQVDCWGLSHR